MHPPHSQLSSFYINHTLIFHHTFTMADNYPTYTRPTFDSICLTQLSTDERKNGLQQAVDAYRDYLETVMEAQKTWLAEARAHEQAEVLPQRDFGEFETEPCMTETPMEEIEFETIPQDPYPLYAYLPTDIVKICVEARNLEAVPRTYFPGVVLAFDLYPFKPWISPKCISDKYHRRWCYQVERENMESFIAIFPTDRFQAQGDGVWTRDSTKGHFDIVAHGEMNWPPRMPESYLPAATGWGEEEE
ncbi:hypothetical protein FFR93_39995 [Rhizobium sp. MHM7A]|nr:hypothetical protein FFR93_39995 [Rhizobium sp. MHM7A]